MVGDIQQILSWKKKVNLLIVWWEGYYLSGLFSGGFKGIKGQKGRNVIEMGFTLFYFSRENIESIWEYSLNRALFMICTLFWFGEDKENNQNVCNKPRILIPSSGLLSTTIHLPVVLYIVAHDLLFLLEDL